VEGFSGGHVWGRFGCAGDRATATATARGKEQPTQAEAAVRSTCTPSKQRESDECVEAIFIVQNVISILIAQNIIIMLQYYTTQNIAAGIPNIWASQ